MEIKFENCKSEIFKKLEKFSSEFIKFDETASEFE